MKSFSYNTRKENIKKLKESHFDLFIIGGGINGSGVARDAASRGMNVAVVEANDFASGTSSRSSKLVHGGIRYLENYEFSLVFEALSERAKLFDIAPHLVHPLRFVLPIYEGARVGMIKMGLGMFLYDLLSVFEAPQLFERLNKKEAMERLPLLEPKGLKGAYAYSDGYMDDDRLVVETFRSANQMGACIVNYVKAKEGVYKNGKLAAMICEDTKTGETFQVKAKHFVGSLGPWTDIFGKEVLKNWQSILRPTKGVHITVHKDRVHLPQAVVMFSNDQKRIIFGIPRNEMIIFGTTDTDFSGDPREVKTTKEDVEYLLKVVAEHFPGANLKQDDIIASYSGVRPLVDDGSATEGKTSREHTIIKEEQNITLVAGGKYTTYRLMAEEVVEAALESFTPEERVSFHRPQTREAINPKADNEKLDAANRLVRLWEKDSKFSFEEIQILANRHGMEAEEILNLESMDTSSIWQLEALHALENTMCLSLRDFYLRRSPLFLGHKNNGMDLINDIAPIFSDSNTIDKEIEELKRYKAHEMSWR